MAEAALLLASRLEWITAMASLVTAVGIVFAISGAWIAVHQLAEAKLARQSDFIANAVREWDDARLAEARARAIRYNNQRLREVVAALSEARSPELAVLQRIPDYFEFIALAADAGRISSEVVWRMFGGPALAYWDLWRDSIEYLRTRTGDPRIYIEFEELVQRFKVMPGD
jgi:hypothetical protein